MTAFELLTTLQARGVRLSREGVRLRIDAPAGLLTATDRQSLTVHKDELLIVADFDPELALLGSWFRQARAAGRLPDKPFLLAPWQQVTDPAKFYAALERDLVTGKRGPRARFGGLTGSLRRLRAFVEMTGNHQEDGPCPERTTGADE